MATPAVSAAQSIGAVGRHRFVLPINGFYFRLRANGVARSTCGAPPEQALREACLPACVFRSGLRLPEQHAVRPGKCWARAGAATAVGRIFGPVSGKRSHRPFAEDGYTGYGISAPGRPTDPLRAFLRVPRAPY
jgi:hypothetical protein